MTGRDLAAALRPLEAWADAVLRFKKIAEEAIRLESKLTGIELAQTRLAEVQATVAVTEAHLRALQADAETVTATLAAEREAALAATQAEQAEIIRSARTVAERHQTTAEGWVAQTREAEAQHAARLMAMRATEAGLQAQIDGLRELAQRMATAAGAVLR